MRQRPIIQESIHGLKTQVGRSVDNVRAKSWILITAQARGRRNETELSYRQPKRRRFQTSLGSVSNIPERKSLDAQDRKTDRNWLTSLSTQVCLSRDLILWWFCAYSFSNTERSYSSLNLLLETIESNDERKISNRIHLITRKELGSTARDWKFVHLHQPLAIWSPC